MAGWVLDEFDVTELMSTYLVAYTVNDFESRETVTKNGVVVKIWARRDAIDQTEHASGITPNILEYFENTFQVKFPFPKIDMIAIPYPMRGGMENWGNAVGCGCTMEIIT